MKYYLSGPMTGYPDFNVPAFNAAATHLRKQGLSIVNPADLDLVNPVGSDWFALLRRDLKYLLDCDAVILLEGWEKSAGARLEVAVARNLQMKCYLYSSAEELEINTVTHLDIVK